MRHSAIAAVLTLSACQAVPAPVPVAVAPAAPEPAIEAPPALAAAPDAKLPVISVATPTEAPPDAAPAGMVVVPAGPFHMGCDASRDSVCPERERPYRQVTVDTFYIDRTEVTVAAYRACVQAGVCTGHHLEGYEPANEPMPGPDGKPRLAFSRKVTPSPRCNWGKAGRDEHPINCVSWFYARDYCAWAGKRLPTEAEWEKAARGPDGRMYPWGDNPGSCDLAVRQDGKQKGCGQFTSWPVGSKPKGASPYGALDMAGNVWEWVADWYAPPDAGATLNPAGPSAGTQKIGKGGCWGSGDWYNLRASTRHSYAPTYRSNTRLGFRCAKSVDAQARTAQAEQDEPPPRSWSR